MASLKKKIRKICAKLMKVRSVHCYIEASSVPIDDQGSTKCLMHLEGEDPDGFFVATDDSGFVEIPEGRAGSYIVHAWIKWEGNQGDRSWTSDDQQAGWFYSFVEGKNADGQPQWTSRDTAAAVPGPYGTYNHTLWEGHLNDGDVIEVFCQQNVIDKDEFDQTVMVQASGVLTVRRLGDRE
jgi:hypothetical protein